MKKLLLVLCLLVSCSQLQAEDVGYASEVNLNRDNQQEFGIVIQSESAGWPKDVLLFTISCPSTRKNEKFYQMSIDLRNEQNEYYFRTTIMTFRKNGIETGYFQIHKSKIEDCRFIITYKDNKGVHLIHVVDLKSYLSDWSKVMTHSDFVFVCKVVDEGPLGHGSNAVQKSYKVSYPEILYFGLVGLDLPGEIWIHHDSSKYPRIPKSGFESTFRKGDTFIAFLDHVDKGEFSFQIVRADKIEKGEEIKKVIKNHRTTE